MRGLNNLLIDYPLLHIFGIFMEFSIVPSGSIFGIFMEFSIVPSGSKWYTVWSNSFLWVNMGFKKNPHYNKNWI